MMALQLTALFCFMTAFQVGFVDAFRSDYTFIESTHSYYKLYNVKTPWTEAKSKCELEGAVLFHPDNKEELQQVFSVLNADGWMLTGLSNLRDVNVFETVDGRPVNQVHDTWQSGFPTSVGRCAFLLVSNYEMENADCSLPYPYICKHSTESVDTDVKTIIANASVKIADLERQVTNKSLALVNSEQIITNLTAELEALKRQQQQEPNQPSVLEVLMKTIANQTLALQQIADADANQVVALERLTANQATAMQQEKEITRVQVATQTSLLEQLMEVFANQSTTMHQQTDAMKELITRQDATIDRQVAAMDRQTAVMDRQVRLLEKFVNTDQLQERSEQ